MSNFLLKCPQICAKMRYVHEVITHRENLNNINNAFEQMKAGDCIRFGIISVPPRRISDLVNSSPDVLLTCKSWNKTQESFVWSLLFVLLLRAKGVGFSPGLCQSNH